MASLQAKQIETILEGIVHADTQRQPHGFDLTAAKIYEIDAPGRIDFGGGELEAPPTSEIDPSPRDPEDDYGWWELEPGTYLVEYNEWLESDTEPLLLQPRDELLAQGVHHPTLRLSEIPKIPLIVGEGGARIKENARISTLLPA